MHTFAGLVWIQVTPVKWVVCTRAIKIPKMDPIPLEGPNAVNWSSKKRECTTNDFHSLIQHSEAWLLVLFFHPQLIWVKRKWKTCSKDHWQTRKVKGVDLRILHPIPRFTKHKAICNKHRACLVFMFTAKATNLTGTTNRLLLDSPRRGQRQPYH